MKLQIGAFVAVAAVAGASFGLVLRPSAGQGSPAVVVGGVDDRRMHAALNMDSGDHRRAAALGYDLFDVGPDEGEINALPRGGRALVWVGNSTCSDFAVPFDRFASAVRGLADNPRVYGWYLSDEPNTEECPQVVGEIRRRADLIHRTAPGQKAFASLTDWPLRPLRPEVSHLDLIGLDPYPCRTGKACDLEVIDRMVRQAEKAGFPRRMMVPVFQTFGQGCSAGEKAWRLPEAGELRAVLDRWDKVLPSPAFDISYSWGRQEEWACPTLEGSPELQAVMKTYISSHRGRGVAPVETPAPLPPAARKAGAPVLPFWGKPVVADEFNGGAVNPRDWAVQDAPHGRVNPTTAGATRVKGGVVRFTGAVYGGRDLSGGIYSRHFQRYGRWEVRLKAAPGSGYAPGVFLWPESFGRPLYAEIDFAEIIDPTRRTVGLFLHHGPENTERQKIVRVDARRWHTYAVEWLPNRVTYLIDGKRVWNYRGSVIPPRGRMGLIIQNEQICHRGPGDCRNRATPAKVTMDLDWVRIYRSPR